MSDQPIRTYARIDNGAVAELFSTSGNMCEMFSATLVWIDVTSQPSVAIGWLYDGQSFSAPQPPAVSPLSAATIAELQVQLQSLAAQIAALARTG